MNPNMTLNDITIKDVKDIIAFDKTEGIGKSLCGLVDCWYQIKLKEENHAAAINYTLNKLGKKLGELAKI